MARILSPTPHAVVPASIFANGWPRGAAIFPSLQLNYLEENGASRTKITLVFL